jgi:pimeloyl-ACP methyl ester carboxylesterase
MGVHYKNAFISFDVKGEGPELVLLHGFTESSDIWTNFVNVLQDEFRVITIDLPGHGKSECIADVHSMELMADAVKAVLDHLKVNTCVMVGHSMGGYVTLAFSKAFPGVLKGIGLFHSTSLADNDEAIEKRNKAIEIIKRDHSDFLLGFIPELFAPESRERLGDAINKLMGEARKMSPRALIAAQEGMKSRSSTLDVLINTTLPVMFIAGQKDSRVPFENIWVQMALTETAYSLILRSSGHMGFLEEPKRTLDFTAAFARACYQ